MQKGDGRPVQQGGAPIAVLLLGTDQLQHRVETAPHPEAEFLQRDSESSGPQLPPTARPAESSTHLPEGHLPASTKVQAHLGAIAAILHLQIQK